MKTKNKYKGIVIFTFILILSLFGCNSKPNYQGTALEPVNKLINVLYFNKGTYSDYTSLFTNPKLAFTEEQFNNFREKPDRSSFKYGSNSLEDIMNHMKSIPQDANLVTVYYLEDVNKTDVGKALMQWKVENRDGKWLLKND